MERTPKPRIPTTRVWHEERHILYTIKVWRMESETLHVLSSEGSLSRNPRRSFLGLDLTSEAESFNRLNRKRTLTAVFAAR